jgi:ribonucleoside-triphosphate reductase
MLEDFRNISVLKKNETVVPFDGEKIKSAIRKSAERVNVRLTPEQETFVVSYVSNLCPENDPVQVKTLHNYVELALDSVNNDVARSYREYRNYKTQFVKMLDQVYRKKLELHDNRDTSNANADSELATTQKAIAYAELNGELYKRFFLTDEENRAQEDGYIYIHDKGARLDVTNCCLFDMKSVLSGGFHMGNVNYREPKSVGTAISLMTDIMLNAGACQYGGFTVSEVDKLLAPYAKLSYDKYYAEFEEIKGKKDPTGANLYATKKLQKELEEGATEVEMRLNSATTARGDFIFSSISFGLSKDRFGQMITSAFLKVRRTGAGTADHIPVLFPKLTFLYDEDMHGEGKEQEWLFKEAVECTKRAQYPDFLSMTGDGYAPSIYKKYGVTISRMGCRANLSPWYERGGIEPADENDRPVYEGRFNCGAISLNFPMIVKKAQDEDKDFYEVLTYYLDLCRKIHIRTLEYLSHKKAGINPLAFCEGGFYGGHLKETDEIGRDMLRPMTVSFGITALNEATVMYNGKTLYEDHAQFAEEVLHFINDYANKYKKEDGVLYAIYGTPAESLCATQVEQFRKKYGVIKGVSDRKYMSNSFHVHVSEDITPIEKMEIEYRCFHLCNGGNIVYNRFGSDYNTAAYITLIREAMKCGYYYGCNISKNYCCTCGAEFLDEDKCPKCGSSDLVRISRVCGYLGLERVHGDTRMNDGKRAEIDDRKCM